MTTEPRSLLEMLDHAEVEMKSRPVIVYSLESSSLSAAIIEFPLGVEGVSFGWTGYWASTVAQRSGAAPVARVAAGVTGDSEELAWRMGKQLPFEGVDTGIIAVLKEEGRSSAEVGMVETSSGLLAAHLRASDAEIIIEIPRWVAQSGPVVISRVANVSALVDGWKALTS